MSKVIRVLRASLALTVVATLVGGPLSAQAAEPIKVSPGAMGVWEIYNEDTTSPTAQAVASSVFVGGPATPALGSGSLKQWAKGGHKTYFNTRAYDGTPLTDLDLGFSTYTTDTASKITTAVNISVDGDGDGISDVTLTFEPYDQPSWAGLPPVVAETWQTWDDAQNAGWWRGSPSNPEKTLADWAADLADEFGGTPTIATLTPQGGIRFAYGSSGAGWSEYDRYIDNISINGDTYDLEQNAPVVVRPGSMAGWSKSTTASAPDTANGFVLGAGTPPMGSGSTLHRIAGSGDFAALTTSSLAGVRLAGIDLSYWTYVASNNGAQAPALKIRVDNNNDGIGDATLIFEPYLQKGSTPGTLNQCGTGACPPLGAWKRWDAGRGGWWSTSVPGSQGYNSQITLKQYAKDNPGARVAGDPGAVKLESGSSGPSWIGTEAYADLLTINGRRFDMEPFVGSIDCDETDDDIAVIQDVINSAVDGGTIKLKGTCDLSAAPAHGGDITSVANTALLVRPSNPFSLGLTIESDGATKAILQGGGDEVAITIAPGNDKVTVRNLQFVNFGRAVVAINNDGATIGGGTGMPSATGNRIIGGATMDDAIIGMAIAANPYPGSPVGTIRIGYGTSGASATYTGQNTKSLTDFNVVGNYISYNPPGAETGTTTKVGIAVRQRFENEVVGVNIERNAVGMFGNDFPTVNMNSVQIHSLNTVPTSSADDYLIRDVSIVTNNFGRLEELPNPGGDLDPRDVHSGGRIGILAMGMSNFNIDGNGVRARLSSTGPVPMPGGGIVVSDSGFGTLTGNSSVVLTDPSTLNADLGAFGIVEDLSSVFGSNAKAQATRDIVLRNNRIGPVPSVAPGLAQRGLVVTKASRIVAHDNDFVSTTDDAVNLGITVQGPGSVSSPGPVTLPTGVSSSIVCNNRLDGATDAAAEVTTGDVTSSAFPTGGTLAGNTACAPSITSIAPSPLNSLAGDLTVTAKAWPNRTATVRLADAATLGAATVVKTATAVAAANGTVSVAFPQSVWSALPEGTVHVSVVSTDDVAGITSATATGTVLKDTIGLAAPTIDLPPNGSAVPPAFTVSGSAVAHRLVKLYNGPTLLGQATAGSTGQWQIGLTGQSGSLALRAVTFDENGNPSPDSNIVNLTVDPSVPAPPVITSPFENEIITTNAFTISGTATPGLTIQVRKTSPGATALLGTVTADVNGDWSLSTSMVQGLYRITARAVNGVGTPSADAIRTFRVKTDFDVPDAPVITAPTANSLHPQIVNLAGTAEPGSRVRVYEGNSLRATTTANSQGAWSTSGTFADGTHTIEATATDDADNVSARSASVTFTVDGSRPRVTITTPDLLPHVLGATIAGTANDNRGVTRVHVRIMSGSQQLSEGDATLTSPGGSPTQWSIDLPVGTVGLVRALAVAYDAAGNVSSTATVQFLAVG